MKFHAYDHPFLIETVRARARGIRVVLAFLIAHAVAFIALSFLTGALSSPVYMTLSSCLIAATTIASAVVALRPPSGGARRTAHQTLLSVNLLIFPILLAIGEYLCPECEHASGGIGLAHIYILVAAQLGLEVLHLDVTVFGPALLLTLLVVLVGHLVLLRQGWDVLQAAITGLSVLASVLMTLRARKDVYELNIAAGETANILTNVQSTLYDILHERQVLLVAEHHLSELFRQYVAAACMLLHLCGDDTSRALSNALWALQETSENVLRSTTSVPKQGAGGKLARDILGSIADDLQPLLQLTGRRLNRLDGCDLDTAVIDMDHRALQVMLVLIFSSSLQWMDTAAHGPFDVSLTCQMDHGLLRARLMLADPLCSFIRRDQVLFQRLQSLCRSVRTAERLGALEIEMTVACAVAARCEAPPMPSPVEAVSPPLREPLPGDVLFLRGRGVIDEALCMLLEGTGEAVQSVYSVKEAVAQVHLVQRTWRCVVVSVDQVGWDAVTEILQAGGDRAGVRVLSATLTRESLQGNPVLRLPCTLSELVNAV